MVFSSIRRRLAPTFPSRANRRARLRTAAPLLVATCLLVSGCAKDPCVTTVEGCLTKATYNDKAASAAEEIRSSPEFEERWDLDDINVPEAWAHLEVVHGEEERPGSGVTVGMIDTGIDLDHPTFKEGAEAGDVTEEFVFGARDETGERFSHGTAVASVIAGRVNPMYRYPYTGIAPHVRLKMFAIPLGSGSPPGTPHAPITLSELASGDLTFAGLYREVLSRDLDVLNLSFGVLGLIENYNDVPALRAAAGRTIAALAQDYREDKTIIVWAAGNSNGDLCRPGTANCIGDSETDNMGRPAGLLDASSPDLDAGLMAHIEELRGHSIAAVATGEDGEIASFSNRCGIAADWCIAAPGHGVRAAYLGPYQDQIIRGYARLSGTSFAAPMVTGGLALMTQMFRSQVMSEELVTRLFRTADKNGVYADRSLYGQGLMDLDAALAPFGKLTFATGDMVAAAGDPVQQASLNLGGAFGSGLTSALSGQEIAGFDSLGAPFWHDLGHFVRSAAPPSAGAQLRDFITAAPIDPWTERSESYAGTSPAGPRLGFGRTPGGATAGHALLARDTLTLTIGRPGGVVATAFTNEGDDDAQPASGALVSWRAANAPLGLRAGWLGERHSMLSATAQGAFGDLAAHSFFVGLDIHHHAGGWRLSGGPEFGLAEPRARGGIIAGVKPLATSAFALHASRPTAGGGMVQVSLAQPLRVEGGNTVLSIPVGRTRDREVVRRQISAGMTPAGRQLDLSVRWERPLAGGDLRLGAIATRHAGHDADARPEISVLAGWRLSF